MRFRCVAALAAALLLSERAQADSPLVPLGEAIARANTIVIGKVQSHEQTVVHVSVESTLLGPPLQTISFTASSIDPTLPPPLEAGTRLLGFFADAKSVAGEFTVIELTEENTPAARELTKKAIALREQLRLAHVRDDLRSSASIPRKLLRLLLEELTLRVTGDDAHIVREIACDRNGAFARSAQQWATLRAGTLRDAKALPCLEETARNENDPERQLASVIAVGNLRDRASSPLLLSLLPAPVSLAPGDEAKPTNGDAPEPIAKPVADPNEVLTGFTDPDEEIVPSLENAPGTEPIDPPIQTPSRSVVVAAVHALGKIGDVAAIDTLFAIARGADDLELHSTIVNTLGLIGTTRVYGPLSSLASAHPNPLIRDQAKETLARLRGK